MAIIFLALAIVFAIAMKIYVAPKEPEWVVEINNKIDLEKCGIENCQACTAEVCENFDGCKIESRLYACGPACDAVISYCVKNQP